MKLRLLLFSLLASDFSNDLLTVPPAEWKELMTRRSHFGAFASLFHSYGQFPYREIFNTVHEDHPRWSMN